jgi:hypothetical protein
MPDPNLGEVVASVSERVMGTKPTDNIFNSRAFFFSMGADGFKETAAAGRLFEYTLEFAENSNFHSYSEVEQIDTTRVSVFDAARYNIFIAAGAIVFSKLEQLRAQGEIAAGGPKFPLIEEKIENGRDSHIADLNRQFLGAGVDPDDVDGIQVAISSTPTTGTVGGINRATFSFWRNQQNSGAQSVTAFDNLRSSWTSIYNLCSLGGVKNTPRWVQTTRTVMQGYEQILVAIEQIAEAKMKDDADIAFKNEMLKFKGAKVFFDEDAVAGEARFYNNTNLKIPYLKNGWMKAEPPRSPHNQLTTVNLISTFCSMATNASRHLGVSTAIT